MEVLWIILSIGLYLVAMVCGIVILVNAFKDEVWKGVLCILGCGLYMIYYAFIDYDEEHKWLVVGGWLGGGALASFFASLIQR